MNEFVKTIFGVFHRSQISSKKKEVVVKPVVKEAQKDSRYYTEKKLEKGQW